MIDLVNHTYQFSLYKNLFSVDQPEYTVDINQLYEIIRYGYLRSEINLLRRTNNKQAYNKLKKESLPAVTLSGLFNSRKAEGFISHSGLIQIDLDHVEDFDTLFNHICDDVYTYIAFRSPGGDGIKVIIKIQASQETHLGQFFALQKYYKDYFNVELDASCKDIARTMLLSFDPDIYCNPHASVYEEVYVPPVNKPKQPVYKDKPVYADDVEAVIAAITKQLVIQRVDITDSYETWIKVGFSISNSLGESGRIYFHQISVLNQSYTLEECDKTYDGLIRKNNGCITVGTLVYLAKEAGVSIRSNSHRTKRSEVGVKVDKQAVLFDRLKKERLKIAREQEIPAFLIFTDKVLEQLVDQVPKTKSELSKINGLGKQKISEFGGMILKLTNE